MWRARSVNSRSDAASRRLRARAGYFPKRSNPLVCQPHAMCDAGCQAMRDRTTDCGKEARNNTTQTQSRTMSLKMNSPARFQAIGSVDPLHLTTPGVVKKKDHVIANVI